MGKFVGARISRVGALFIVSLLFAGCDSPLSTISPTFPPTLPPLTIDAATTPMVSATPSVVPSNTPTKTLVELTPTRTPQPTLTSQPTDIPVDENLRLIRSLNRASEYFDFSPDSRFIAVSNAETVVIYDATSEEVTKEFEKPRADEAWPGRVVFSPEGSWLAAEVGDYEPNIYVWDLSSYQELKQFSFPELVDLGFSYDGQLLAAANQLTGIITIWDLQSGVQRDLQAIPNEIAFSPKQPLLASAELVYDSGPAIRIWDMTTYQETPLFHQSESPKDGYGGATSVAFSSDGSLLVTVINNQLRVWNLEANQETDWPLFKSFSNLVSVRASSGGIIAILDQMGVVTVLNINTGDLVGTTKIDVVGQFPMAIALSPDGHYLLTGGGIQLLQLWEIPQE